LPMPNLSKLGIYDPKLGQRPKKNSLKVSASQRLAANRNGEARELDKKSSLALGYCPE